MIQVRHSHGDYGVEFGSLVQLRRQIPQNAFVITDNHVAEIFSDFLKDLTFWTFPAGESSKNLDVYADGLRWLAESHARRDSLIIAFGGGVVGDLAGFIAATYMRGVHLWQVPTTLLAQVDSSVGGKVGLDLAEGKNLVGAFFPPDRVYVPLETLRSLPERQFNNGMAEVWKYGFILDADMVSVLERYPLNGEAEHLQTVVERCIWLKAEIVEEDERETTGQRAVLNFGHTIGHAIERLANYEGILHGEAISVGMVAEALLGERMGTTRKGTADIVRKHLEYQGLPTSDPRLVDVERAVEAMRSDKKADHNGLAFSLLTEIGGCKLVKGVPETLIRRTLAEL